MKTWHKYYPLSILLVLIACWLSLFNPAEYELFEDIHIWDKLTHSIMYLGVTIVFWYEYLLNHSEFRLRDIIIFLIVGPALLGGLLELAQEHLTTVRSGDWIDFYADMIGVVLGAAAGWWIERPLIQRYRSPK
ncbi:MAG: hypothetical protein MJY77_08940 [Bacteroidaceae bacterium]|nr:hypothetical protein [Bacteroidaceae bacterium]